MKRVRDSAILFGFAVAALALPACPASLDDRCAAGACQALTPGDGAVSPEAGNDAAPTDPCIENPSDPKCLKEDEAFFVSDATGDDAAGLGTRDKPFKKLGTVLGKITEQKKRIYVCEGTYPEDVVLEAKHAGVSVFGGFTCDWATSPNKPKFGATTMALKITGATGVAIADVAFEAKDASTPGGSSIAAFIKTSEVTFKSVSLAAGKGQRGEDGKLIEIKFPSLAELAGNDASTGAAAKPFTCPGDASTSTTGGKGGESGVPGDPGTPGPPNGGTTSVCSGAGSVNTDGAQGLSPGSAAGATARGDLQDDGWKPRAGENGAKGGAGQGGGGGYGSGGGTSKGGGGGAGGCGGAGGGGGMGGGGSIALASLQSTVRVETSTLSAREAGNGGDGAAGQSGQPQGGTGGNRTGTSCNGGNGGPGGNGAAGGGGAGGVSVGVLYKGLEPVLDSGTAANIVAGVKGTPGGGPGNAGMDGTAAQKLEIR